MGCAGIAATNPILGNGLLSAVRYEHGRDLATAVLCLGLGFLVWAWVRLGRDMLAGRAGGRAVAECAGVWPWCRCCSLRRCFSRDVYAYLAQGRCCCTVWTL